MKWQDVIIVLGQLVFIVALLPMLWDDAKPPLRTSIPTTFALLGFMTAYTSLGLAYSAATAVILAVIWGLLALQGYVATKT